MPKDSIRTRLCLVTPAGFDDGFAAVLDDALGGGDVASLIIVPPPGMPEQLARRLGGVGTRHGVATLIAADSMPLTGLDGVHVEGGAAAVKAAIARHHPKYIVGAGGALSRHDAMIIGEAGPDYLFFGRLDGDGQPGIHPAAMALAEWWVPLFEIPAVVTGGSAIESVGEAAGLAIEFVALRSAVWNDPRGPRAAVADANRILAEVGEPVR
ncbi:MAG: thiamine phosphate synthase [Bauldia sp.]